VWVEDGYGLRDMSMRFEIARVGERASEPCRPSILEIRYGAFQHLGLGWADLPI
jgi:hypothetical protein